ncbi:hypothetical protein JF50_09860 [Pseudoalteromonas luteoviolacea]|uniref:PD-(D/E)XK endonuclease-like domain-containing protein n=1 Tax=Pseudoalteromonas luteoviolacea TaxID=43657 RepID=A0A0C1QR23_9GAMM|nr:hypothetical protein [Pseudoalteromonas luteoviolacea]KID57492.1 hypothetical protein JF50_09860 [Pseudoalteromonas luteoviolacea]
MISESTFSKKFTSFWNEILPNSKNYVRLINGGLLDPVYEPFDTAERKNNTALVNVLSFNMFRELCNKSQTIGQLSNSSYFDSQNFENLLENGMAYLSKFSYGAECSLPLSVKEKEQASQLFRHMYIRYVANNSNVVIDPKFDGCGFINESFGDIISDHTLVEIKSGERRFSLTDIRQLLIYLVLNHYSKKPFQINYIELFNPRMGIAFTEDVESFCLNISALNSQELFAEVQKFIVDNNFVETFGT